MADIATLGLATRYQDIEGANKALDKFSGSAGRAERAAKGMGDGATNAARKTVAANDNVARSASKLGGVYRRVAAVITGVFASAIAAVGLRQFIRASNEAADVQAQLGAALRSTGGAAQRSIGQINAHAAALQRVTRFGDEVINSAQGILLSFTRIRGDQFDRATESILDVATAMKMDLKSAAIQVGKALNDPVVGMTALSRSGITFTEAQKEMVKQLVESGDMIGAQTIILKELETQFGGSAKAARETLGGALASLRNAWGDLFELGKSATEPLRLALEALIVAVQNPAFIAFVQTVGTGLVQAFTLAINGATMLVNGISLLVDNIDTIGVAAGTAATMLVLAFGPAIFSAMIANFALLGRAGVSAITAITAAMARNPLGALAVGITIAITALYHFRDNVEQAVGVDVIGIVGNAVNFIINTFRVGFETISVIWQNLPDVIGGAVIGAANATISHVEGMLNRAAVLVNDFVSRVNSILPESLAMGTIGKISIGRLDNPYAERLAAPVEELKTRVDEIMASDPIGSLGSMFQTTTPEVEDFSGAIKAANDNLDELSGGAGGGLGGAAGAAKDALGEVATAAKDAGQAALDFSKDLVKGFVNDIRSGLEQGKGFWRSFADAAINAMNKIGDKLVDLGIDMMFSGLTGSVTAGGTGAAAGGGGIFGMIGKLFGFRGGGPVRGPGTGTSDDIPAMLSNGEFVVNAEQTRKFRPLLEAVNDNDIPNFAIGGAAGTGGHPGIAGNGPGSGIAGSGTGQGPGPGGGTSAGATGIGGSASGLSGHPGIAGGAAGQHGGSGGVSGGQTGIGGSASGLGGHPGIAGGAAGQHGGSGGIGGVGGMGGFGGPGHPGMVGNAAGDRGLAAPGSASQGNKGDFGGPTSVAPGLFGSIADAVQGFPAAVVAAMTPAQDKMQDRLVSSVNKMQDRIAPTRPNVAMKAIDDRIGIETGIPGPKSDLSAIFGDIGQSAMARSLNDAMTAIANNAAPSNPFGASLGFPTGRSDAANSDLANAIAAMSGNPVPGNPFGGFPSSSATSSATSPSSPASQNVGVAPSPFAGFDTAIDDIFGGLKEASDVMAGANATLGFHGSRVGAVGGGRELEELRGMAEGGFAGFFARGGRIPAGQWGIAGEDGPEPVIGPATVLPNSAMGGGDAPVINMRGGDVIVQGNADEKTLPLIRREIAASEARMQKDLANNLGQYQGRWSTFRAA